MYKKITLLILSLFFIHIWFDHIAPPKTSCPYTMFTQWICKQYSIKKTDLIFREKLYKRMLFRTKLFILDASLPYRCWSSLLLKVLLTISVWTAWKSVCLVIGLKKNFFLDTWNWLSGYSYMAIKINSYLYSFIVCVCVLNSALYCLKKTGFSQ